eukprot:807745-Amphidinium_carterae.1
MASDSFFGNGGNGNFHFYRMHPEGYPIGDGNGKEILLLNRVLMGIREMYIYLRVRARTA